MRAIKLTKFEAKCLLHVAGNGNGEDEFFVNSDGKTDSGSGGLRGQKAYYRAVEKIRGAMKTKTK